VRVRHLYVMLVFLSVSTVQLSVSIELITDVKVLKNKITIRAQDDFHKAYLKESSFFVEYYDDTIDLRTLDYSIVTIPFILNVIPIVWVSGKQYTVDAMDVDFYHAMNQLRTVFEHMYPSMQFKGTITPRRLVHNSYKNAGIDPEETMACMFSHGLDALCASLKHRDKKQLLITVQGNIDTPLGIPGKNAWQALRSAYNRMQKSMDILLFLQVQIGIG
jgi:hypothetical protein